MPIKGKYFHLMPSLLGNVPEEGTALWPDAPQAAEHSLRLGAQMEEGLLSPQLTSELCSQPSEVGGERISVNETVKSCT